MSDEDINSLSYGKIIAKSWVPHIIWAVLALIGAYYSGDIKNHFSETNSFYSDRRAYWRIYSDAFSDLRVNVWETHKRCISLNKYPKKQRDQLEILNEQTLIYFVKLGKAGFNITVYFPSLREKHYNTMSWFKGLKITCDNSFQVANKLLTSQRSIVEPMWSIVYGEKW